MDISDTNNLRAVWDQIVTQPEPPNMGDPNYQIRKSHSGSIALRFDDEWELLWVADDDTGGLGGDPLQSDFVTWDLIYPRLDTATCPETEDN
ncbi:Uncharacterised protein [Mycobacteroides abscessus subsp. massiliense]|nr:Uncharacterised protein [Mycobacteroides abscessus subsp. massiliense]